MIKKLTFDKQKMYFWMVNHLSDKRKNLMYVCEITNKQNSNAISFS